MKKIFFTFIFALSSSYSYAFPVAPFNALGSKNINKNRISLNALSYDFEGIVKLSNCSGALVVFNGQPLSAKAVVMTNGHCIQKTGGFLNPGEVWINRPLRRVMRIFDKQMKLHQVVSTKILYATMTNTDLAYYELSESYLEIFAKSNIRPLLLDSARPLEGQSIDIISGYWDRGYSCDIDGFVFKINEGTWTFTDSIRYTASGCNTIGGTSGSPITARGERVVVGINNTSNESGDRCTLNNPCEVDEVGEVSVRRGTSYGQQTYQTYSCLTPAFTLDLNREDCGLPR